MSFSYGQVLLSIVPVFGLVAIGIVLRRLKWVSPEADSSIMKLVLNCLYPALIFESILKNDSLRIPSNLITAPLCGFVITSLCIIMALLSGRALGLTRGHGLRTFAFATGMNNYSYFALSVCTALFGQNTPLIGLTLVFAVGVEAAVWTIGIFVLSGLSLREGWKKAINGPVIALVFGLFFNLTGLHAYLPQFLTETIHRCGLCGLTVGIILSGCVICEYVAKPATLFDLRVTSIACLLRLGVCPLLFLIAAKFLPITSDLKNVLLIQAAMPAALFPIALAKHYGGQALTAAQVFVGTTALGILTIPLWINIGMSWLF